MRGGVVTDRVIEPYVVYPYRGAWFVTAFDHARHAIRDFKVQRMLAAAVLDERYTIPPHFSFERHRAHSWGVLYGQASEPVDVDLLFDAEAARWAQEEGHEGLTFEGQDDGFVRARFATGITDELVRWVAWFGPRCRVTAPASLRRAVLAMAVAAVDAHSTEGRAPGASGEEGQGAHA
jgi:predicted DNA-binding transcriptional regulator YafY